MTQSALVLDARSDAIQLLEEEFRDRRSDVAGADAGELPWPLWDHALVAPLSDFLSRPGKGFRERLVRLSWDLSGRKHPAPPELPLIIEVLHAGSLIVDDIEDGSAYRRGAPALHVGYGLPRALNAGNWLYFWPASLLARLDLPPVTELALHRVVGRTLLACHEGQALDLSVRIAELEQRKVLAVVSTTTALKTGKLFELAAALGAIAAGAPSPTVRALKQFGQALGTGLQMLDDLGGIVSEARCHSGHEDLVNGRATWPWAWAAESLDRLRYAQLRELAREVAARERHPEFLSEELREVLGEGARENVRRHLQTALTDLRAALGASRALDDIAQEIAVLEQSYG